MGGLVEEGYVRQRLVNWANLEGYGSGDAEAEPEGLEVVEIDGSAAEALDWHSFERWLSLGAVLRLNTLMRVELERRASAPRQQLRRSMQCGTEQAVAWRVTEQLRSWNRPFVTCKGLSPI